MKDELMGTIEELLEEGRLKREEHLIKYPPDLPNEIGHHAFIKGITIENSFSPSIGEYNFLFETGHEKIYVWTHSKNENSALVSDIDVSVKRRGFWKTAGSMIKLSLAYYGAFEAVGFHRSLEYKMMYYFVPNDEIGNITFSDTSIFDLVGLLDGQQIKATDMADLAPVIELMNRDDRCFTATSLLLSSFQIHYFCLTCEIGLSPYMMHESHEPELWEQADFITNMESAIVQACRCAESILGEPPNQGKRSRELAHKQRWIDGVGINPDDEFERCGMSYWEFYQRLFDELRNPSAHSYGDIHFDLQRKHAIDAQCFAALVLRGYIRSNVKDIEAALDALRFNREFLGRVQSDTSTKLTRGAERD